MKGALKPKRIMKKIMAADSRKQISACMDYAFRLKAACLAALGYGALLVMGIMAIIPMPIPIPIFGTSSSSAAFFCSSENAS